MSIGSNLKKLFSGKYDFYVEGKQYAEESFEVIQHTELKTVLYRSYLSTRSATGELLKLFIDYELTENFHTKSVKIKKSAGKWATEEDFIFDHKDNILHYTFKNPDGIHKEERIIVKRFYIQTPSVLCSALFSTTKKPDNSARNPIVLIKSPNILNYDNPLEEYTVFVSYETRDGQTFTINQNNYLYTRCELYATDLGELENEFPIVIQVSKKFSLPFLVQFDRQHQARLVQLDTAASIDTNAL